ncbi:MAG: hypothetical protein HLX51_09470 [Micrococcaceae bacterium]|nr:hypothetical protein [Micrococcaceae bacterium]
MSRDYNASSFNASLPTKVAASSRAASSCISVLADGTRTTGFDLYEELVLHHQLSA